MRIAFLVRSFPAISQTFVLNQITGLIDRGHEVDIYAFDPPPSNIASRMHPDVKSYALLDRTYYVPVVPTDLVPRVLKAAELISTHYSKEPTALLQWLNVFKHGKQAASLWLLYKAVPLLGKKPYDIIHCQFGTLGLIGMNLRDVGIFKGKMVTSFRGHDISWYIRQFGDGVYKQLFETGDFFLVNCDFFKRRLIKLGCDPEKIVVHRSGINCDRFAFAPSHLELNSPIRVVTIGRLVEKKGIEYCISAIASLLKTKQNLEFNIIGDGPLRDKFERLIEELRVGHAVKLLGNKHQQEIIEILSNSHIFVAPSVTAKDGDQDAPINTLKEAMAIGLPVISTCHGGIPELVEDGVSGFLVPERDADAIAEKLNYLIDHPEIWSPMSEAGRAYVEEHYDTNKLNNKLVKIYQRLLIPQVEQRLVPQVEQLLIPKVEQ